MRRQAGFSLLEVVVAFSILAFSLGVLYQAFGRGLGNLALSGRHGRAVVLAESILARHAGARPLREGRTEGSDGPFRWRVEVAPHDGGATGLRLFRPYRLEVTVSWEENGRIRSHALQTLRLGRL